MLSLERGEIEVEQLKTISEKGMLLKYKAELASQHYTKSVNSINAWVKETLHQEYIPSLTKIQKIEEDRIGFTKIVMSKFIGGLTSVGDTLNHMAGLLMEENQGVSIDSTLAKFINKNISENEIPNKEVQIEMYQTSQDFVKYKKELETRQFLARQDSEVSASSAERNLAMSEESTDTVEEKKFVEKVDPAEKARRLMY